MNAKILLFLCMLGSLSLMLQSCKDNCDEMTWYADADGDGFGDANVTESACDRPDGFVDNSSDVDDSDAQLNPNTVWQGEAITFTKENNADWNEEVNQDRITDNVWLTRKDNMSLFNIAVETGQMGDFSETLAPTGTQWASGSVSDGIGNLNFDRFVGTLDNNVGDNILNGPMVLYLEEDNIYLDINFTSWAMGSSGGGYSYTRSTRN